MVRGDDPFGEDGVNDDEPKKKCCGCPIQPDFSQAVRCPSFVKIIEIVLDTIIIILSITVITQRMDEEGNKFMCSGPFVAFITCVVLSMIASICLLCFYIVVYKSKTNQRLRSWVKSLDLTSAIFMLIGFITHLYILIKWQFHQMNKTNENVPYLGEMIVISAFTFINMIMYFLIVCVK